MAAAAPGSSRTFPGSCRNPGGGSSTIVPSRSRNTARWRPSGIEGGTHRAGDLLDLVGEDGPGVEDHAVVRDAGDDRRSEEHTSELQSRSDLVCRLLLEKKKK